MLEHHTLFCRTVRPASRKSQCPRLGAQVGGSVEQDGEEQSHNSWKDYLYRGPKYLRSVRSVTLKRRYAERSIIHALSCA